jgi:hypothetical protein
VIVEQILVALDAVLEEASVPLELLAPLLIARPRAAVEFIPIWTQTQLETGTTALTYTVHDTEHGSERWERFTILQADTRQAGTRVHLGIEPFDLFNSRESTRTETIHHHPDTEIGTCATYTQHKSESHPDLFPSDW